MFKNVMVGVDGRSGGRDAIALARRLMHSQGKLALVHVHLETTGIVVHDFDSSARDEAQQLLEDELDATGVAAELVSISSPSVGAGLHRVAEQNDADLLVVGTSRHGFVGRVLMGDDTRAALEAAPCAVAIPPLGYAQQPEAIEVIGVGYDASPESRAALALARTLAADSDAKVRALTVVSVLPFSYAGFAPMNLGAEIETLLDEARSRLDELDGVEGRVVYGMPVEALAAFGDEVDLLLVGSRSYGPLRHLMLGSTSRHLTRTARCPLLVLPRAAAEPDAAGNDAGDDTGIPVATQS
ncbi:MAG: universal stress protein [Solirubrobacteraceae bacterium]